MTEAAGFDAFECHVDLAELVNGLASEFVEHLGILERDRLLPGVGGEAARVIGPDRLHAPAEFDALVHERVQQFAVVVGLHSS